MTLVLHAGHLPLEVLPRPPESAQYLAIRYTEGLAELGIVDQCVASAGVSSSVLTTTRSTSSSPIERGPPGRGSSCRPSRRCTTNRATCLPSSGSHRDARRLRCSSHPWRRPTQPGTATPTLERVALAVAEHQLGHPCAPLSHRCVPSSSMTTTRTRPRTPKFQTAHETPTQVTR
jgi:hypothetical protein